MLPTEGPYRQTLLGQFDQRVLSSQAARVVLAVLLGAILIIPSVQFVHRIEQVDKSPYRAAGERHRTALGRWLPDAEALTKINEGADPYGSGHWFPTPPFVLMCLIPFWMMGYTAAGVVWVVLKVTGFIAAMALLIRELGRGGRAVPLGVLVMTGVFSLRPIVSDIHHGNLNIFMMIWLALAWTLYMRGKDVWAGLFVALAVVTKITPALVLVYFLYKRAWRVCIGAAIGLVLFFILLPSLTLGFGQNIECLTSWYEMLVEPVVVDGYLTLEIKNQSLQGVLLRLLSNAGILSIESMPVQELFEAGTKNMARPASIVGQLVLKGSILAVLLALAWFCRTRSASRRDPRLLLEFGMVLLAMLLLGERTWKHHSTTLPIVYLGVWTVLTCHPWSDRFRAWFVAGLAAQLALLLGTSQGLLGDHLADLTLDGGLFCWGLLLCFLQICVLLETMGRASRSRVQGIVT